MRTLYLHIGRGKTGTTAIQQFFANNHDILLERGIHYLRCDGGGAGAGHQHFAKTFIPVLPAYMDPPHAPESIRTQVIEEVLQSNAETIVLSSENFELADVSTVHNFFNRFLGIFAIKIIFFVRSQDELVESEYNQMVKLKSESRSFSDYIKAEFEGSSFLDHAKAWEEYFGRENMLCRIVDCKKNDALLQFIECLPCDLDETISSLVEDFTLQKTNASVGYRALTISRILNTAEIENRLALYSELYASLQGKDLPALLFTSEEAERFRAQYAQSNLEFTSRYVGEAKSDLAGRRYSDVERDDIVARIKAIELSISV